MRKAPLHPRTLGYLGRALSLELTAVQQYMTQASLVGSWGIVDAAARLRAEMLEEMQHAERIVQRMLALGVSPNASQLRPAGVARTLGDLLLQDADLELEIIGLYTQAVTFCEQMRDLENLALFQSLLTDEIHHAREIDEWLAELGHPNRGQPTQRESRAYF